MNAVPRSLTTCNGKQTIIKGISEHTDMQATAEMNLGLRPDNLCGLIKSYQHGTQQQFQVDRVTQFLELYIEATGKSKNETMKLFDTNKK